VKVKEKYQFKVSNSSAALENLDDDDDVEISRTLECIRENIKASATDSLGCYELKQHKPWFYDECSKWLDERKQAKLQWLQNTNQRTGHNLNNFTRDSRTGCTMLCRARS
jgi:hypothetical protein